MKYENIEKGIFIDRPNRFIANVETKNGIETSHVKNTGRCREILLPGAEVYLERNFNPARKTALDLISVVKNDQIINMDSSAPNKVVVEWLKNSNFLHSKNPYIKPETTYGNSRFDVYAEDGDRKIFIEVKGVTLEEDGVAKFPDAPTTRGVKHIEELIKCRKDGYEAYIFFVIQMKNILYFTPNIKTHKEFGEALKKASGQGVKILAYDCDITETSIDIRCPVDIKL